MKTKFFIFLFLLSYIIALPQSLMALEDPGKELKEVGVFTELGKEITGSLEFTDDEGKRESLSQILAIGKPTILVPVYYSCPRMCGLVLSGVTALLNEIELKLGSDYQVIAVSFDPEEGTPLAKKRAEEYRKQLKRGDSRAAAWRFFTGEEPQIKQLMSEVGFGYKRDGEEFAHSSAIIVLTHGGKISQYFTGIDYSAWDVRLSLVDASEGVIGSSLDHVLLFCYRFDPTKGRYTLAAMKVMKIGGVISLLALGLLIFLSARKGRVQKN